jgi:hypothetical protein
VARTIIGRYGGVVEKFIGDAVMAVWGTPVATEGDAERAVRAALDLVAGVADLGVSAGVAGLAARAGVVTGEVAVTLGAAGEGMVAGDAVNTAARVQAAAGPGTVLVDGGTQRLAAAGVAFADAGEHALKGKSEPQHLWRAVRVLAGVGGAQRVDGLEAALTGRDAELRTIRELFHAAAEREVPRMVVVSGPAGVGKSRLGWEFEKHIDGLAAQVWWHRGRCLSYGDGVAFWALAEIIRQRLGIAEDDPAEATAAKLVRGLDQHIPDPAEREYVGARLGKLLGVTPPGGDAGGAGSVLAREELFAGWRLFVERLAATAPVVLLVEDAHHADAGLLDFLDYLTDWVRGLPVFVLVLARPELAQARPGFGAGRNRTTLTLDPLDPASMDVLVDALVPGMPPVARAAVTGRAQGLPLFAVEIIRSLIDRDIVQPFEGEYRLVGDIGELEVPGSLHALLAARLDALDPAVRRLVADAAVLGTTFPADALAAVSDQDQEAVRAGLAGLLRREILGVSADRLSPERGSYYFAQDMLRQVAYDTLSRRDRKARHLAVAAHLKAAFPGDGEEVADVIARHYLDALHALPDADDAGKIREDAIRALTRAADRGKRTGAPATAASSYATAAQLAQDFPQQIPGQQPAAGALWERASEAAFTHGDLPAATGYATRAQDFYLQHGQARSAARAQGMTGAALEAQGRVAEARQLLTAALEVLRPEPDADTVRALQDLSRLEVFAGSPDADRLTTEALVLGQALNVDANRLARLFTNRGVCLYFAARNPEGIAYLTQAARFAEQAGDKNLLGTVHLNLSEVLATTDSAAAAEAARTAAGHTRQAGDRPSLAIATGNLVQALLLLGDWDAAAGALSQAVEADGLGGIEYLRCNQAWLAALRGDADTAEATLVSLQTIRGSEALQDQSEIAVTQAFIAAARSQPGNALACARRALAHADALGMAFESLRWAWPLAARAAHDLNDTTAARELLAQLDARPPGHIPPMLRAERDLIRARDAARNRSCAAETSFAAAITALRAHSTPYHLAHGLLDHAQYLHQTSDTSAAAGATSEARTIASQLRCQPLTDRAVQITPAGTQAPT